MNNKNKWLITIDLDGTFLRNDSNKFLDVVYHEKNKEIIDKLRSQGHIVSIVTGRPWRDAKKVYESLGLNTIIGNYNGAHLHNPEDMGFSQLMHSINRDIINEMVQLPSVKFSAKNLIIESLYEVYARNINDKPLLRKLNISEEENLVSWNEDEELRINPQSLFIDLEYEKEGVDAYELVTELNRKFGNAVFLRVWDFKNELNWMGIEVAQKGANKGSAMKLIASYYNISPANTIAFGDGLNDREMLQEASVGVAMKNAKGTIKTYANDVTDKTNNEGGVGYYLEKFFEM